MSKRVFLNPIQRGGLYKDNKREYNSWLGARYRCQSPKHPKWDDYGGRGIQMCQRWVDSFADFLADMGPRPLGMEIDRIDNDGNYEPGNCRWVPPSDNARNKTRAVQKVVKPRSKLSKTDCEKLARIERIKAAYDERMKLGRERLARLEAERNEKLNAVLLGIPDHRRPDFY